MKAKLTGFKYFLDKVELKDYDDFEKKIKNLNIEIKVNSENKEVHAKTV